MHRFCFLLPYDSRSGILIDHWQIDGETDRENGEEGEQRFRSGTVEGRKNGASRAGDDTDTFIGGVQ